MMELWFAISLIVLLSILSFLLGYDVAETHERKANQDIKRNLRLIERQKHTLSTWVRANWPDEYGAWRKGHLEGYQQGILQSAELERDHAESP